ADSLDLVVTAGYGALRALGVPFKVNDLLFPIDFFIVDADAETPLFLGRPFLATCHALIDDQQKELVLGKDDKEEAHHEKEYKEEDQELLVEGEINQHDVIEKEEAMRETSKMPNEDIYGETESQPMKIEDQNKLFPNYDSQFQSILDEFMKTGQASFDKLEAHCGNLVENAFAMERQLVEIEMTQHAIMEQEEFKEKDNGMRGPLQVKNMDLYVTPQSQPMKIQEEDLKQKEHPSNKAEEKAEIDKVIDMICALFATV
ncbi:hypothetical protein A2U01_0032436, partial [Trifolium medium]|nr:hypothetical protein [Trifolium medium]